MDKYTGKRLDGRYEIQELIGVGGMAVVYKAYDTIDDRTVAIKILKDEFLGNQEFIRRFKNESKAIAVLDHPNIVKVYDVSFGDRLQYIVMEYIDGISLKEYLNQQKEIRWKEALHFTMQILRALQHAHEKGIIHRDIKPENIFYDGKQVYLFDFDIARNYIENQKRDTTVLGSQGYAAPEQFGFYQTDIRSDIYSLGVLYHVLLTNKLPRDYDLQGIEKRIIDKMIAIDPQGRYQDVKEIIKDLDQLFHIEKKKEKKIKHPNALPGFRSGKLWKMIVAIMGYLLFIWILISFKIENQPISQYQYFVYRLILIAWFIITLLFSTNYLSVRDYLPYYKNHRIVVKVLTTIISWLILLFISIIIGTLLMYF